VSINFAMTQHIFSFNSVSLVHNTLKYESYVSVKADQYIY